MRISRKKYNFLPGPVEISKAAAYGLRFPTISQRNPDFEKIYFQVQQDLRILLDNPFGDIVILSGSGTLGMESVIDNFINDESLSLVINAGKFGHRFYEILSMKKKPLKNLDFSNNRCIDYSIIESELENASRSGKPYSHFFCQATETSTGVMFDLTKIKKWKEKYNLIFIVDAISHILSHEFSQLLLDIDCAVFSSQKALNSPTGLSFISLLPPMKDCLVSPRSYYCDYSKYIGKNPPFTPAVNLIFAVSENMNFLFRKGIHTVISENQYWRQKVNQFLREKGFEEYPKEPSQSINVFIMEKADIFVNKLYQSYNISISKGQGELKSNVFRIGHMGIPDRKNYGYLLKILKKTL